MSRVTYGEVVGRVISIPGINGIAWFVPYGRHKIQGKVSLFTLPLGRDDAVYWSTLQGWIDKDWVEVGDEYPSWQDAALRLYTKDVAVVNAQCNT